MSITDITLCISFFKILNLWALELLGSGQNKAWSPLPVSVLRQDRCSMETGSRVASTGLFPLFRGPSQQGALGPMTSQVLLTHRTQRTPGCGLPLSPVSVPLPPQTRSTLLFHPHAVFFGQIQTRQMSCSFYPLTALRFPL